MQELFSPFRPPTFAGFLGLLDRQKFRIGMDHHLRLQRLLETVGRQCDLRDLKTLLCPIFATSVKQQKLFYETYDRYFDALLSPPRTVDVRGLSEQPGEAVETRKPSRARTPEKVKPQQKWPYTATFTVVFLVVGLFAWWKLRPPPVVPAPAVKSLSTPAPPSVTPTLPPATTPPAEPYVPEHSELQHILGALRWAVLPVPLLLFGLYELLRYRRRKLVVERKPGGNPPYQWL
jgi:hypothetical protein